MPGSTWTIVAAAGGTATLNVLSGGAYEESRENQIDFFKAIGRTNEIAISYGRNGRKGSLTALVPAGTSLAAVEANALSIRNVLEAEVPYWQLTDFVGSAMTVVVGKVTRRWTPPRTAYLLFEWTQVSTA